MNTLYNELKRFSEVENFNSWFNRYTKIIDHYLKKDIDSNFHRHHILPKSLYPEYEKNKNNLVKLPYKVHYVVHYILWKMTDTLEMALGFHYISKSLTINAGLYEKSLISLYEKRKNKVAAKNIITGINELTDVSNLNVTHIHTTIGKKWWLHSESGKRIFTEIDMTNENYTNTHNINCAPSKVYWSLDENDNRYRTEDESKKVKGSAPWQKGFNKINKESTRFLNLITKKIEYISKQDEPEYYHYRLMAYEKHFIPLYVYNGVCYFKTVDLPDELDFNLRKSLDIVNNVIPDTNSYVYKKRKNKMSIDKRKSIELNGGKTLHDLGLRVYDLLDENYSFDFSNKIFNFEFYNRHN